MKKIYPTLIVAFLFISGASTIAVSAQTLGSPASQQSSSTVSPDTQEDELRTQQEIAAENKFLRGENKALKDERVSDKGKIEVLTLKVALEHERGDFFKSAAEKGQKLDANSGLIKENLQVEFNVCNARNIKLEEENKGLRSSRNWRTLFGFGGGVIAGVAATRK